MRRDEGGGDRFKRCHHNTQYIRQTHLHALWHFIDTDYNNNKRIPIGTGCTGRGRDKRARRTSSILWDGHRRPFFLTPNHLHICIQKWFHRFGCQSDGGEFVSFSHMKTTERKTEDQSLIFGNRMKTKKWWIIIRLHFLRGTDLRDSPKMRGCSNRILDNIQTEKVRVLFLLPECSF